MPSWKEDADFRPMKSKQEKQQDKKASKDTRLWSERSEQERKAWSRYLQGKGPKP